MTLQEKLAEIAAQPGVIGAGIIPLGQPTGFETLHAAKIAWYIDLGNGVTRGQSAEFIITGQGTLEETVYAIGGTPAVLQSETKFLTSRTAGGWADLTAAAQFSAIESFCNGVYIASHAGAANIREFSVAPINGSTIKASGFFDLGTTWQFQTWYIRLIDPNGSVAAPYSNVEFQQIVA